MLGEAVDVLRVVDEAIAVEVVVEGTVDGLRVVVCWATKGVVVGLGLVSFGMLISRRKYYSFSVHSLDNA